jgi:hypothetical protein
MDIAMNYRVNITLIVINKFIKIIGELQLESKIRLLYRLSELELLMVNQLLNMI